MSEGRKIAATVSSYLEALTSNRPKRGRRRTPDSIEKRLQVIEGELSGATALARLLLLQEQMDLKAELQNLGALVDMTKLEDNFVRVAKTYGESKGISAAAWKAMGVPAEVLVKADITR